MSILHLVTENVDDITKAMSSVGYADRTSPVQAKRGNMSFIGDYESRSTNFAKSEKSKETMTFYNRGPDLWDVGVSRQNGDGTRILQGVSGAEAIEKVTGLVTRRRAAVARDRAEASSRGVGETELKFLKKYGLLKKSKKQIADFACSVFLGDIVDKDSKYDWLLSSIETNYGTGLSEYLVENLMGRSVDTAAACLIDRNSARHMATLVGEAALKKITAMGINDPAFVDTIASRMASKYKHYEYSEVSRVAGSIGGSKGRDILLAFKRYVIDDPSKFIVAVRVYAVSNVLRQDTDVARDIVVTGLGVGDNMDAFLEYCAEFPQFAQDLIDTFIDPADHAKCISSVKERVITDPIAYKYILNRMHMGFKSSNGKSTDEFASNIVRDGFSRNRDVFIRYVLVMLKNGDDREAKNIVNFMQKNGATCPEFDVIMKSVNS